MNDDERTVAALRVALDERAAEIEPGDRLDEILERARPHRPAGVTRPWMLLAAAAAVLAVVAGVWLGLPDGSEPVPGGTDRPLPSASPSGAPQRDRRAAPSSTASTPTPHGRPRRSRSYRCTTSRRSVTTHAWCGSTGSG